MQKGQYFVQMTKRSRLDRNKTYSSLIFSLFTICSFDIKDNDLSVTVSVCPDTLCGLVSTIVFIHDVKFGVKK